MVYFQNYIYRLFFRQFFSISNMFVVMLHRYIKFTGLFVRL